MRILHTADLHLGRQFNGVALDADHDAVLAQIAATLVEHDVDALVIAGDVFDRASPPASAVRRFNGFLSRVASETRAAVVAIAGNHDSGDRIEAMSILTDGDRALIRGVLDAEERPLVLRDRHGPVAFTGLPFAYEYAARERFGDETIRNPEDVLRAQIAAARPHVPEGARRVIVAHAFVSGGVSGDAERPLTRVGGVETVGPEVFDGAHYVALGHLHRPQRVGAPHVRYSGSPLAFGFDEADAPKSMSLVDLDGEGRVEVRELPFAPVRRVRVVTGRHAELLRAEPAEDLVRVVLTDEAPVIDGMKRIREVFPNACELVYERRAPRRDAGAPGVRPAATADPVRLVGDFLDHVREDPLSEAEREVVAATLGRIREREDAE